MKNIKRILGWALLFVVVFAGVLFFKSYDNVEKTSATPIEEEVKEVEPEIVTSETGKELNINGTGITVVSNKRVPSVQYGVSSAKAKGEYLVLDILIKNKGKTPFTIDANMFLLKLQDTIFASETTATLYLNNNEQFLMQSLNPGLEVRGKIAFDVPKGLNGINLQVNSPMFTEGTSGVVLLK